LEAAIVTPFFLLLLFGIWTTARAWNVHNVLDHAAREAARYGAVDQNHASITTIAQGEVVAASFPWADVTFCSAVMDGATVISRNSGTGPCIPLGSSAGQDPTTDERIQVSLLVDDYPLDFLFFSVDVDLRGQAVARLEP
jgi:Flp pilus assembly protein TadG